MLLARMHQHPFVQLLLLAICLGSWSHSQAQGRHEGWYQVELLVFSRPHAATEEQWPKAIKMRYPARWVALKDPQAPITEPTEPADPASQQASSISIDFTKEPYWMLPAGERSLNDQAQRLARNNNYQVLFHQAWRQPIGSRKQATSILIHGGQHYGAHQELEGSINLSVATYLKLSTNLWFSQFQVNLEQDSGWPDIPLRPDYQAADTSQASLNSELPPSPGLALGGEPAVDQGVTWGAAAEQEEVANPYVPRQIILMQQDRDMRSGEVHYLDHPLLGVIVKVTPFSANSSSANPQ